MDLRYFQAAPKFNISRIRRLTSAFLLSDTTAADSGLYRARDPARTYVEGRRREEKRRSGNSIWFV